jgi:biopolymer transport protein ExbD
MARSNASTGLESAPDIMLLTMAALMVAIVWLASLSHETSLPPIDLPTSDAGSLGTQEAASVHVTLRPGPDRTLQVFLEEEPVEGGIDALASVLAERGAGSLTLRADAETRWEDGLSAMSAAASAGMSVSVAVDR